MTSHKEVTIISLQQHSAPMSNGIFLPVVLIYRGVDVARLNARYRYPENPHTLCTTHTLERVDSYMNKHGLNSVQVIADETSEASQVHRSFAHNRNTGTGGYRSSTLSTISSPILFAPSHECVGLQTADKSCRVQKHTTNKMPRNRNMFSSCCAVTKQ